MNTFLLGLIGILFLANILSACMLYLIMRETDKNIKNLNNLTDIFEQHRKDTILKYKKLNEELSNTGE